MADKRDYYEVLGVDKNADDATLKKAYRTLAKKYHPDAHPGDKEAEAKFKEASEAYAILSDPDKRRKYDQFGHAAFEGGGAGGGYADMDMSDIFSSFGDIFGDLFGGGFGGFGGGRSSNGPQRGASVQTQVRITFDEAMKGCKKEIEMPVKELCKKCNGSGAKPGTSSETCPKCNGQGRVVYKQTGFFGVVQNVTTCPDCGGTGKYIREKCPDCGGGGYISVRKKLEVNIPAGIDNGQSVRLRDLGEPGKNGGPRGDILVQVIVGSHDIFHRQDMDIFSEAYISFAQAALGGEIMIPTIDGNVVYEIKPGTQSDTRIRLKGKGAPSIRNAGVRGDHYVTLVVKTPTGLSKEAKEALIRFDEASDNSLENAKRTIAGEESDTPPKGRKNPFGKKKK